MGIAATLYTAQVAIGMVLWPIFQYGSLMGWVMGFIAGVPFVARIGMHETRMPPGGMHEELHSSPGWPRIKSLDELLTFLQCRVEGGDPEPGGML